MDNRVYIYLVTNAFQTYVIYKMFRVFFRDSKVNRYIEFILFTIYFAINSVVYLGC